MHQAVPPAPDDGRVQPPTGADGGGMHVRRSRHCQDTSEGIGLTLGEHYKGLLLADNGHAVVIATKNVKHLSLFTTAQRWHDIPSAGGSHESA